MMARISEDLDFHLSTFGLITDRLVDHEGISKWN